MRKTSVEYASAGILEIKRQIDHYRRLGEGKPNDHEYNVTAEGLRLCYMRLRQTRRDSGNLPDMKPFLVFKDEVDDDDLL